MNLTENEKRMVYQVESTCQAAILNEIAMNKRYAPKPGNRRPQKAFCQNCVCSLTRSVWLW